LPSIRELLRHGENAWLVEPAKPLALVKGVMTIADDASLSRKLSAHAKELAKSYSWENRVQILLDSLNKNHPS
jgi:glycosyltransferase involved in cell wall biosynthesis